MQHDYTITNHSTLYSPPINSANPQNSSDRGGVTSRGGKGGGRGGKGIGKRGKNTHDPQQTIKMNLVDMLRGEMGKHFGKDTKRGREHELEDKDEEVLPDADDSGDEPLGGEQSRKHQRKEPTVQDPQDPCVDGGDSKNNGESPNPSTETPGTSTADPNLNNTEHFPPLTSTNPKPLSKEGEHESKEGKQAWGGQKEMGTPKTFTDATQQNRLGSKEHLKDMGEKRARETDPDFSNDDTVSLGIDILDDDPTGERKLQKKQNQPLEHTDSKQSAGPTGSNIGSSTKAPHNSHGPEGANQLPSWIGYLQAHQCPNGQLDPFTTWEGLFQSQAHRPSLSDDIFILPPPFHEWSSGYFTGHQVELSAKGEQQHSFFYTVGSKTYRVSRLSDPADYNLLLTHKKMAHVYVDTRKTPTGHTTGIINIGKSCVYLPPPEALDIGIFSQNTINKQLFPQTLFHSSYFPRPGQEHLRIGKLAGRVVMHNIDGRSIQVYQQSPTPPQNFVREIRWTSLGTIPWPDPVPLGMGCPGYEKHIQIGSTVYFDTVLVNGVVRPNRVELCTFLNSAGKERYSDMQITPTPITSLGNSVIPTGVSFKTLQPKHWETLWAHTDSILPPTMIITENFSTHMGRKHAVLKSLSTFIHECTVKKKLGQPLSFDTLFSEQDLQLQPTKMAIMIETNDVIQQTILQILTECLDTEVTGTLSRTRKQTVHQIYVTVSFGQIINEKNIYEMGGNGFMQKKQNPYLGDVVFLKGQAYLQAYSSVLMYPFPIHNKTYLTDPAFRGMLVLSTYNYKEEESPEEPGNKFTVLQCTKGEKEKILDTCNNPNQVISYRCVVNPENTAAFKYLIDEHKIYIISDAFPPSKGDKTKKKLLRYGSFNANMLSDEKVESIISEYATGGEIFLMTKHDQQAGDPNSTYLALEMRPYAKQDQGRSALNKLIQKEYQGTATFWPITGFINKYWVKINKPLTRQQISALLLSVNKIYEKDSPSSLNTFLSFTMQGVDNLLDNSGSKRVPQTQPNTQRRMNNASIAISGWPCQVTPKELTDILAGWGVPIDVTLIKIDWFHGSDAEGVTLRIQTPDLGKARELLLLSSRSDFEFEVGEFTTLQQTALRLIATTPSIRATETGQSRPKPRFPQILSDTQIAAINKINLKPTTILGKATSPPSPTKSPTSSSDGWDLVSGKHQRKTTVRVLSPSPAIPKGVQNSFAILESTPQGETQVAQPESAADNSDTSTANSHGQETAREKEQSTERLAQEKQKSVSVLYKELRADLTRKKLWGRDTGTVLEAYFGPLLAIDNGYELAIEDLKTLLSKPDNTIKQMIEDSTTSLSNNSHDKDPAGMPGGSHPPTVLSEEGKLSRDEPDTKHQSAEDEADPPDTESSEQKNANEQKHQKKKKEKDKKKEATLLHMTQADKSRFTSLKTDLRRRKLWGKGKATSDMVDSYCNSLLVLGHGYAGDELVALLKFQSEEIKKIIEDAVANQTQNKPEMDGESKVEGTPTTNLAPAKDTPLSTPEGTRMEDDSSKEPQPVVSLPPPSQTIPLEVSSAAAADSQLPGISGLHVDPEKNPPNSPPSNLHKAHPPEKNKGKTPTPTGKNLSNRVLKNVTTTLTQFLKKPPPPSASTKNA